MEALAGFHIEPPAVGGTGDDVALQQAVGEGIFRMRAGVFDRIKFSVDVKDRNFYVGQHDRLRLAGRQIANLGDEHPLSRDRLTSFGMGNVLVAESSWIF